MNEKINSIRFSIVVCTYNREKFIRKCLDSLVHLDFPKDQYEIIVVDDGSTDATVEIVKEYPVRLIVHKKNRGVAAARNTGLKNAKGSTYVCFDDDCYADKDWLTQIAEIYDRSNKNNLAGVGGTIKLVEKSGIIEKYMDEFGYGNPSPEYVGKSMNPFKRFSAYLKSMFSTKVKRKKTTYEVSEIWGANCSFPVSILKRVKGWDENLSGVEDADICNRIKKQFPKKKFICTPKALLYHDHKLSFSSLMYKPYIRGLVNLKLYLKNSMIPPLFPFPPIIVFLVLLLTVLFPLSGILSLILLPQIFYSWWVIKFLKKKQLYLLLFPYLQMGFELFTILGILRGFAILYGKVSTRKILLIAFVVCSGINYIILSNINFFYTRELLSSIYLLFFPGFLTSWAVGIKYKNIWEFLVYSLGLSIALLMFIGLGINYLLPYLHSHFPTISGTSPLAMQPILFAIFVFLSILFVIITIRNNPFPLLKIRFTFSIRNILLGIIPVIFPLLSIVGAITLNNNQQEPFTLIMLCLTAFFVVLLTVFRNKVSEHIFPFTLFMVALALLLMTSLRGWYITGHDIFLEYYVFQLTKAHNFWSMANFQDPYTACLSITILPTILSNITHINDYYIYKVLYQIIYASSIVVTYLFIKKFINPFLAFLGTFAIVSLPTFMTDMPMLNRQEIGLLFFAFLLNTLFTKYFPKVVKWFLLFFFAVALVLSHYSTTYITVGLFIGAFFLYLPLRIIKIHPNIRSKVHTFDKKLGLIEGKLNLRFDLVLFLLLATVFWNITITKTDSAIITTVNNIVKDLSTSHFAKAKNDSAAYVLINKKNSSNQSLLASYVDTTAKFVRQFNDDTAFLNKTIYSQYPVTLGSQVKLPLTTLGKKLNSLHMNVFNLNDELKQLYAKVIQIFIIIGFIAVFFLKKHIKNLEKEYLIFTITFFIILVVETVLPSGAIDYGILRLFQQGLILFSVPLLMGGLAVFSIFNFIHKDIKVYLLSFTFVFFFLYLSGVIPMVTGGYYPQLNLSNAGFYYDAYYTHTRDKVAMDWLATNRDIKTPVQSDWFALKKIHTYEQFYSVDGLIPSVIRRNSYVYLSVSNVQLRNVIVYVGAAPLYYTYDFSFLDKNKNLIYTNGGAKIYR